MAQTIDSRHPLAVTEAAVDKLEEGEATKALLLLQAAQYLTEALANDD